MIFEAGFKQHLRKMGVYSLWQVSRVANYIETLFKGHLFVTQVVICFLFLNLVFVHKLQGTELVVYKILLYIYKYICLVTKQLSKTLTSTFTVGSGIPKKFGLVSFSKPYTHHVKL